MRQRSRPVLEPYIRRLEGRLDTHILLSDDVIGVTLAIVVLTQSRLFPEVDLFVTCHCFDARHRMSKKGFVTAHQNEIMLQTNS